LRRCNRPLTVSDRPTRIYGLSSSSNCNDLECPLDHSTIASQFSSAIFGICSASRGPSASAELLVCGRPRVLRRADGLRWFVGAVIDRDVPRISVVVIVGRIAARRRHYGAEKGRDKFPHSGRHGLLLLRTERQHLINAHCTHLLLGQRLPPTTTQRYQQCHHSIECIRLHIRL